MGQKKRLKKTALHASNWEDPRILSVALFLFTIALYANTLGHSFVFDDGSLVLQNPQVTQFRWAEMFGAGGYRPVRTVTYALNYALGRDNPFGYHLFNVLLHGLNVLLLFRLVRLWSGSTSGAWLGAALFASHPVQTAAVAYVSGRKDLLATFFLLGGMALYARFRLEPGKGRLAGCLAFFALAIFSKENAVVFPVLLILAEALLTREEDSLVRRAWKALWRFPVVLIAAVGISGAGVFYVLFVSKATRMVGFWGGTPSANYATSFKLFVHYVRLVVWPHPLIADYKGEVFALSPGFQDGPTLLSVAFLITFLTLAFCMLGRLPALSVGMLWFFVCLTPVLQWVPFHELAADHFLYLPMAGVALMVAEAGRWASRFPVRRWLPVAAAVLLAFSIRTVMRNRDWKDALTLWESTYAAASGSYRANANLGQLYYRDPARREEAMNLTRRARELSPEDAVAWSNLGAMEYLEAQRAALREDWNSAEEWTARAIGNLEEALTRDRRMGSVYSNLGNCYKLLAAAAEVRGDSRLALENQERAIRYFETALKVDPKDEVKAVWYNLGLLYVDRKDWRKAASCFREFLKVRPTHGAANQELGRCLLLLGDAAEAVPFLEKAVRTQPTLQRLDLLAQAYQMAGRSVESIRVLETALPLLPSQKASIQFRLGLLHWDSGNLPLAEEYLRAAASGADPVIAARARAQLEQMP